MIRPVRPLPFHPVDGMDDLRGGRSVVAAASSRANQRAARSRFHSFTPLVAVLIAATLVGACSSNSPTVAELTLTSEPSGFPENGGDVLLIATVLTTGGAPIAGVEVRFTTSGGTLSADRAGTDQEGIARVRLAATQPVTVRAQVEDRQVELAIRPQTVIELNLNPAQPGRNQLVNIEVTLRTSGQDGSGLVSLAFGDGSTADLGQVNGRATTTHRWTTDGTYDLVATLREGTVETRQTRRIEVRGFGPLDDHIDASQVTWLSPATTNVSDWAITSEVRNISISGSTVCIDHSKAGAWPEVSIDDNPPNIEANIAIVVNVDGKWYGGGFDWLGDGRICKTVDPSEYGRDQIRVAPLDGSWHGPRSGETVGLLITTPSSNRIPVRSVNERTPIVLVTWP